MHKQNVVFGYLGTQLDAGVSESRWNRWRPTVGLCAQPDFPVGRLELFLTKPDHLELAQRVAEDIALVSPNTEVRVHAQYVDDPWDFAAVYGGLHDFARAYAFDPEHENYFVHLSTGTHTAQICMFLLAETRHFPAQLAETAMNKGADEPWRGRLNLINLDLARYDRLASRFERERADSETLLKGGIATCNPAFNRLVTEIETVCLRTAAPLLLTGPTGAGKTQMAKRIFELRARRHLVTGRLVEVNCATLRGDNAMSALFGHKKGAFTGAGTDRAGLLREADGGCLFLDELGELGLDEQAMLLRALEDKRFLPMGSDREVESDFQLIAGTNKDLVAEVSAGRFRADLFARINLWEFYLPGLAQRPEDIEPNLDFELERAGASLRINVTLNSEARDHYLAFASQAPWVGNFRDLSASVLRMATLAEGGRITAAEVTREVTRLQRLWDSRQNGELAVPAQVAPRHELLARVAPHLETDRFDAVQIETVLDAIHQSNSMAEAGRKLFAVSRSERASTNDSDRVRKFLAKWGLDYPQVKKLLAAQAQSNN